MILTNRLNTFLLVLIALMAATVIAILANRASAGPLDPPGPPASTMQTLDDLPGSWDRWLPASDNGGGCASSRFTCVIPTAHCNPICLFTADAVIDHQTGLVWTRDASVAGAGNWGFANVACLDLRVGGVTGWRLPSIAELMGLADPSVLSPSVSLSPGNPFLNTGTSGTHIAYWSSTPDQSAPGQFFAATIGHSSTGIEPQADTLVSSTVNSIWCVRGAGG